MTPGSRDPVAARHADRPGWRAALALALAALARHRLRRDPRRRRARTSPMMIPNSPGGGYDQTGRAAVSRDGAGRTSPAVASRSPTSSAPAAPSRCTG